MRSNTMRPRRFALAALMAGTVLSLPGVLTAASAVDSDPAFVFLVKGALSFWHTATNSVMSVPVAFPEGAASAALSVSAGGYSARYEIASEGDFSFSLPAATSPEKENVYDLALSFDDPARTVRTARLGLVEGVGAAGQATARVQSPASSQSWGTVHRRAVIPIPAGVESFSVDGVAQDTGLGGDAGWFPVAIGQGASVAIAMNDGVSSFSAALLGAADATVMVFR